MPRKKNKVLVKRSASRGPGAGPCDKGFDPSNDRYDTLPEPNEGSTPSADSLAKATDCLESTRGFGPASSAEGRAPNFDGARRGEQFLSSDCFFKVMASLNNCVEAAGGSGCQMGGESKLSTELSTEQIEFANGFLTGCQ